MKEKGEKSQKIDGLDVLMHQESMEVHRFELDGRTRVIQGRLKQWIGISGLL